MSTTSATDRQKNGQGKSRLEQTGHSVFDHYRLGEGRREPASPKWSNNKVLDEMSTFIAEFSYLNPSTQASEAENTPNESIYQTYAATTDEDNPKPSRPPAKSVEWEDQVGNTSGYHKKRRSPPPRPIYETETVNTNSGQEKPEYVKRKQKSTHNRKPKSYYKPVKSNDRPKRKLSGERSSNRRSFRSRSRSKTRKYSSDKNRFKSRPRERSKTRKYSRDRNRFQTRPRVSISASDSRRFRARKSSRRSSSVKYMPFWPEETRTGKYRKMQAKEVAPDPTVVTLYPQKKRREIDCKNAYSFYEPQFLTVNPYPKQREIYCKKPYSIDEDQFLPLNLYDSKCKNTHSMYDPRFLTNPAMTCKCFKCKNKFESVMKLSPRPLMVPETCPKQYQKRRAHFQKIPEYPRFLETCEPNSWCDSYMPCARPFAEDYCYEPDCYTDDYCNQVSNRCGKSIYFKFDCFGQHINSSITQYFQSILNETIC